MYYVYVLYNSDADRFYVGSTGDLSRRLDEHNSLRKRKQYTKNFNGKWNLVYSKEFDTKPEAQHFEKEIKKQKSRRYIQVLIKASAEGPLI